jgi:hypothetical protein
MGYDEKMKGQADHLSGHPDSMYTEKSVGSETMDMNMRIVDPANESYLNKAVKHVNRETQRGEHAPMVGGYSHDPLMGR